MTCAEKLAPRHGLRPLVRTGGSASARLGSGRGWRLARGAAGGFAAGGRRGIVLAKEFKEVATGGEQAVVVSRAVVSRPLRDQVPSRGWAVDGPNPMVSLNRAVAVAMGAHALTAYGWPMIHTSGSTAFEGTPVTPRFPVRLPMVPRAVGSAHHPSPVGVPDPSHPTPSSGGTPRNESRRSVPRPPRSGSPCHPHVLRTLPRSPPCIRRCGSRTGPWRGL